MRSRSTIQKMSKISIAIEVSLLALCDRSNQLKLSSSIRNTERSKKIAKLNSLKLSRYSNKIYVILIALDCLTLPS